MVSGFHIMNYKNQQADEDGKDDELRNKRNDHDSCTTHVGSLVDTVMAVERMILSGTVVTAKGSVLGNHPAFVTDRPRALHAATHRRPVDMNQAVHL